MRKAFSVLIMLVFAISLYPQSGGVSISESNSDPDASAQLDVKSTDKGVLIPRMTEEQRNAINLPATGLLIYQTDQIAGFYFYDGSSWSTLGNSENRKLGNVFTRYGASTAPTGAELLYSGYVYGEHYSHNSRLNPIVIQSGDTGSSISTTTADLLYPASIQGSTISGISNDKYLSAAVCYIDATTAIIWGSHNSPSGWQMLYKGYAFGSYYDYPGSILGPVCIDSDNFEINSSVSDYAIIYPQKIQVAAPGNIVNRHVKCIVVYKN